MKRVGPELKMPDVKVPPFLDDLYWDLRDRRLLPLVALVVAAIVVVPFMLASDAKVEPPGSGTAADSLSAELENAETSSLVVVEAKPGLRDYRRRLSGRTPSNPFKPPFSPASKTTSGSQLPPLPGEGPSSSVTVSGGSGETGSSGGGALTPSPSPAPEDSPPDDSKPPSSSPNDGGKPADGGDDTAKDGDDTTKVTLFTFAINVRIARSGGKDAEARKTSKSSEPVVKQRVLPQTPLPGEKAPVVTYMGMSRKGKPLLLVSTDVKSVFGETKCVSGDDACQLIEAEPGFPVVFVYGYNEVRYTINILKIEPVRVGSL